MACCSTWRSHIDIKWVVHQAQGAIGFVVGASCGGSAHTLCHSCPCAPAAMVMLAALLNRLPGHDFLQPGVLFRCEMVWWRLRLLLLPLVPHPVPGPMLVLFAPPGLQHHFWNLPPSHPVPGTCCIQCLCLSILVVWGGSWLLGILLCLHTLLEPLEVLGATPVTRALDAYRVL
jgi:hypothetical protein